MEKTKNKKPIIIVAAVVVAVILVVVAMLATVESRTVGIWQSKPVYLEKYGCEVVRMVDINASGKCTKVLLEADTAKIINSDAGEWDISGFDIETTEYGELGKVVFHFNPITGTMKNGKFTYSKVD